MSHADIQERSTLPDTGSNAGLQVERRSAFASVVVGLVELSIGLVANSIALLSDGVSSLADASISTIVWLGLRLGRKGRDKKFHFGYYKAETFSSIVAALVMITIAALILYESYISLIKGSRVKYAGLAATVALVAALPSFYLGYRKRHVARSIRSASVSLDSYNSFLGGVSSMVAFFGVFISGLGTYWGDAIAGMLIAGLILTAAYSAFKEGSLVLMDACMCPDAVVTVESIARGVEGVEGVNDVRLRRTGPYITGEVHIEVDGNITVHRADEIAAEVETRLKDSVNEIKMITVRVESKKARSNSHAT